jgi:3-phenylpropionate/cinnamic acid dioxygenase small subunit
MLEALFTTDAVMRFEVPSNGLQGVHSGLPAILQSFRDAWTTPGDLRRHLMSNIWFESASENACVALSYLTVSVADEHTLRMVTTGTYRDMIVNDGGWLFKERHLVLHTAHELTRSFRS